jgi:DNA-binding NtrC family response regulator
VASKRLVAVVDDEMDITFLFRDALETIKGISIFTFTDPKMALEHFKMNNEYYVLIISDFRMPGLNGTELLKKMKDTNPSVRTILMTAFEVNDVNFREYIKQNIINSFLQKPIKLKDLHVEVVKQINMYNKSKT